MNKIILSVAGLMVVFVALTIISASSASPENNNAMDTIMTGSTEMGDASVAITPIGLENDMITFEISINTHSVDLSNYDLTKQTVMQYKGKELNPVNAPTLRGHHVTGEIVFPVTEIPEDITIIIKGIPSVEERVFRWGSK